ncbi:hypothetical protein, partial [Roseibium sp. RKSG952]|uniref:hypothetical protein n=1 Tax=Roseibium sp. RKSG952 TaxID=2529384 RepID=UPI001AD92962
QICSEHAATNQDMNKGALDDFSPQSERLPGDARFELCPVVGDGTACCLIAVSAGKPFAGRL